MDSIEFRRRIIAAWGINDGGGETPDPFKDFILGAFGSYDLAEADQGVIRVALGPLIDMTGRGGHSIRIHPGAMISNTSATYPASLVYPNADGTGTPNGYPIRQTINANINFNAKFKSMRLMIAWDYLADAYVYDNTTGEYLFRGSDYINN